MRFTRNSKYQRPSVRKTQRRREAKMQSNLVLTAKTSKRGDRSLRLCVKDFTMTADQARTRHTELAEEIRRHDHAYYVLAQPTISDRDYDRLYHELLDLDKEFP